MLQKIADTIAAHHMLENCCNLIVGISGGADSVCLLSVLSAYVEQRNLPIKLIAAHVNHGLRGEAADADEAQVVQLCKQWKIPLHVQHCNVDLLAKEQGISVEMAGRNVRYAFFQELADSLPDCKIAVAHNREDRAETILWNVIRGTGLDGLKGIPYVRDNVIRPLLDVSKEEIRDYCKAYHLPVCEDASNWETVYSRNKIRLELIPYMNEKFQTDITEKILRLSDNVLPDEAFLQEKTEEAWKICTKEDGSVDVKKLLRQHPAIQTRILQRLCGHQLEQVHLQALLHFIKQETTGKQLSLPGGIEAVLEYDNLFFKKGTGKAGPQPGMQVHWEIVPATGKVPVISNKGLMQVYDYDLLLEQCQGKPEELCIRTRQAGDVIRPFQGNGSKTLKKFFIDQKIPKAIRDTVPILAIGSEVLWIAGYRRCDRFLPSENTKRYYKIWVEFI